MNAKNFIGQHLLTFSQHLLTKATFKILILTQIAEQIGIISPCFGFAEVFGLNESFKKQFTNKTQISQHLVNI